MDWINCLHAVIELTTRFPVSLTGWRPCGLRVTSGPNSTIIPAYLLILECQDLPRMLFGQIGIASCSCLVAQGVCSASDRVVRSGVRLAIGRVKWNRLP